MVETAPMAKTDRLINVQIMRAMAALMVTVLHAQALGLNNPAFLNPEFHPFNIISLGNGVDIFFVISGFIITIASRRVVEERNVGEFIRRRLVRIVPLYWIVLSIFIGLIIAEGVLLSDQTGLKHITPGNVLGSYFFFPVDAAGFGPQYPFPILDLGWTLNFEMLFYALFAGCMFFGPRGFYPRVFAVLIALVIIGATQLPLPLALEFWTHPITLEFLAGVGLALIYRSGFRLNGYAQIVLIVAGLIVWVLVRERLFGPIPIDAKGSYSWPRVLGSGLGSVLIMAGAVLGRTQMTNWVGRRAADLGDSSYALYLTHKLTLSTWRLVLDAAPFDVRWSWGWVFLMTVSAIAVGHIVHLVIEKPVTRWLTTTTQPGPALA